MRKMFAPLALLFGLLTALMLGSTAVAQAHGAPHSGFNCNNGVGVNVVTCSNVLNNITLEIKGNRALTDVGNNNEISILENNLNNTEIDIKNVDVTILALKDVVVTTYASFNIPITVGDVKVCVALYCK